MADVQNPEAIQMCKLWSQPSCYLAVQEILHKNLFKNPVLNLEMRNYLAKHSHFADKETEKTNGDWRALVSTVGQRAGSWLLNF